jgi:cation:H+ antiporter
VDIGLIVGSIIGLLAILYALAIACDKVESASNSLAFRLSMPASVAGATLLAIASSAPEFFTSTAAAVLYGVFEVGLLTIIWSAIFNILVIPGIASVTSKEPLRVSKAVVYRDGVGYVGAIFILLLVIVDGELSVADAIILLILYGLYLHVLVLMSRSQRDDPEEQLEEPDPLWSRARITVFFLAGLVVIGVGTHFMIEIGDAVATEAGLSILLFSAFVFAPGTSIPDLLVSVYAARRGEGSTAISNVFGSNIFDLTICLAVPALLVGGVPIHMDGVWPSMIILISLQFLVVFLVRTKWQVERWEGAIMLGAFVVACVLFVIFLPDRGPSEAEAEEPAEGGEAASWLGFEPEAQPVESAEGWLFSDVSGER